MFRFLYPLFILHVILCFFYYWMLVKITVNTYSYFARESSNNRQHLYINTHYIYRNMQQDNRLRKEKDRNYLKDQTNA